MFNEEPSDLLCYAECKKKKKVHGPFVVFYGSSITRCTAVCRRWGPAVQRSAGRRTKKPKVQTRFGSPFCSKVVVRRHSLVILPPLPPPPSSPYLGNIGIGVGAVQMIERRTHDREVVCSIPGRSSGRMFFSRVNFLCCFTFGVRSIPVLPQRHIKDPRQSA